MKITGMKDEEISACCTFKFRGHVISCSTICKPKEVMVFNNDIAVESFHSVEEAVKFVLFRE